jgi:hypothetical protein
MPDQVWRKLKIIKIVEIQSSRIKKRRHRGQNFTDLSAERRWFIIWIGAGFVPALSPSNEHGYLLDCRN